MRTMATYMRLDVEQEPESQPQEVKVEKPLRFRKRWKSQTPVRDSDTQSWRHVGEGKPRVLEFRSPIDGSWLSVEEYNDLRETMDQDTKLVFQNAKGYHLVTEPKIFGKGFKVMPNRKGRVHHYFDGTKWKLFRRAVVLM